MDTPPPPPIQRPIRRAEFKKQLRFRLGKARFDYALIQDAHTQAETWINANPSIEIIQIDTFHSFITAITVVWYR
jgi:hypothetical protein